MIKFKQDTTLQVVEGYDEATDNITEDDEATDNITEDVEETFKSGEKVDADIFNDDGTDYVDIQFGDGSVALGVQRDCFEVVK